MDEAIVKMVERIDNKMISLFASVDLLAAHCGADGVAVLSAASRPRDGVDVGFRVTKVSVHRGPGAGTSNFRT